MCIFGEHATSIFFTLYFHSVQIQYFIVYFFAAVMSDNSVFGCIYQFWDGPLWTLDTVMTISKLFLFWDIP